MAARLYEARINAALKETLIGEDFCSRQCLPPSPFHRATAHPLFTIRLVFSAGGGRLQFYMRRANAAKDPRIIAAVFVISVMSVMSALPCLVENIFVKSRAASPAGSPSF
jgi:hypothetical protein